LPFFKGEVQKAPREEYFYFDQYLYQAGSGLNAAGINYQTLRAAQALKRLQELESMTPPR